MAISSPLTGQAVTAATVIVVIVLAATRPALATRIIWAIREPDNLLVATAIARVFCTTAPTNTSLVI